MNKGIKPPTSCFRLIWHSFPPCLFMLVLRFVMMLLLRFWVNQYLSTGHIWRKLALLQYLMEKSGKNPL